MSLITDAIFVKALRSNADLIAQLPAGDVYNTAIALPDEDADNAPLPYVIVSFDGLNNQDTTKDNDYDGLTDTVTIGIEIAAETRPKLGELARSVRKTLREYFREHQGDDSDEDYQLIPEDMTLSAQPVQYDSLKPCYWQRLTYQCDTNIDDYEQD
jgi:hypothetical protein